ncbi:MAG: phosphoenolpyruvate carboxylase [Rhodospirillaceae bacterium]|nr:phosphoenolpyruvate carboxylase [Rhodospirillaceae bacterium]
MSKTDAVSPAEFLNAEKSLLPGACALREELTVALKGYEKEAEENHLQSPIRRLAFYISNMVQEGRIDLAGLEELVRLLTMDAFFYRAQKLREYVGECSVDENEKILKKLFKNLAQGKDGKAISFDQFRALAEREVFGIVITAHPTFSISQELTTTLAALATGCDNQGTALSHDDLMALATTVAENAEGKGGAITLNDEQEFALMAIANIRRAIRRVYRVIFNVAAEIYPNDWQLLKPRLLSVASWVGYDLDGRSDIGWSDTLSARMYLEKLALEDYLESLAEIASSGLAESGSGESVNKVRKLLEEQINVLSGDMDRLKNDPDSVDGVGNFSRHLAESTEHRLVSLGEIIEILGAEATKNNSASVMFAVLRAEMANFGLAFAQTHVRINATQLTNAIRHEIGPITSPEDPANRRTYLRAVSDLLDEVEPVSVNFGSIMRERTTAKRIFMLVAKFLKYVDSDEPVRFLIAECNTAFTVLSALYFAKLFGVADKIDISPLFETGAALEHGHEIVTDLLENPHYVEYIKKRGRMCIQTGFSDAGRYVGQIPASLAIERVRIKMARRITRAGISGVDLVIFDTHGESIGRGAHPLSFSDRLDYTYPPEARNAFKQAGINVKQEVSFQGGDGYVYFACPEIALATVCRLIEHALQDKEPAPDEFYTDTDFSLDFFMSVKGFNERLLENPNYAALLDLFGTNLLYSTGSRKVKRQHEGGSRVDLAHPRQVRAIPHNAILQQLGYFSNSISGLGKAIARDFDRFEEVYQSSDRLSRFVNMAAYARHLSNLDALHGYISLFDPAIWLRRSRIEKDQSRAEQMQRLAHLLRHSTSHEKLNRTYRIFLNDTIYLDKGLASVRNEKMLPGVAANSYPDLVLLHGLRVALIHEIFLIVARLPRFSDMAESSDDVVNEILHLDIEHALVVLKRAFPISEPPADAKSFGEKATYQTDVEHGYEREHRELFQPLSDIYDLVRRISTAVAHMSGAVG